MRVWNVADETKRAEPFEPKAAEVFAVQGRKETREYVAIAFDPCFLLFIKEPCDTCAFQKESPPKGRRLCGIARFVCRQGERKDGRQIVVSRVSK